MRLNIGRTDSRSGIRARSRRRRPRGFENLEARQMLNAAPVANDDSYTVGEDDVLRISSNLPSGVIPQQWSVNGHYYALITQRVTAPQAFAAAQTLNYRGSTGHVVTITSAAEQDFLFTALGASFPTDVTITIGLSDTAQEGVFRWVTGEPLSYTSWLPGEPNDTQGMEDYVELRRDRLWNDNGEIDLRPYLVEFDGPFLNGVLENDTDSDGNVLTATPVQGPTNGALTFNADGTFTYSPNLNFIGTDSFTYKANDGQLDSNISTVTINVLPNAVPVANGDTYTVAEDSVLSTIHTLPPGTTPVLWSGNGHRYLHIASLTNWTTAESAAASMRYLGSQGHLVTMPSAAEEAFVLSNVVNQLPRDSRVHLGLTDREFNGQFRWITGEPLSYTHWNPGEPNNPSGEDYAAMYYFASGWLWSDIPGNFQGSYIVEFDGPFNPSLLANDTDAENDPLTASVVTGPAHGTLALNSNGTFTYTPEANFVGSDSFTYGANDGQANSNVATVTINVTQVNNAPVANPERYITAQNQTLVRDSAVGVLPNDTDLEGDTLSAVLFSGPTRGQLTLNADGSFTYVPNPGFVGHDSFAYVATDGALQSAPTTVSLFVTNPNNVAPVANNNQYATAEDTPLSVAGALLPGGVMPQRWNANGHYYAFFTSGLLPSQAINAAQGMSYLGSTGHLVTIATAAERNFLLSTFAALWPSQALVTIGFTDTTQEGTFRWVTGEPVTYTAWFPGEPNNTAGAEDYVGMRATGLWFDTNNVDFVPYIVEFDGPMSGGVLSNDTDANGDVLSAALVVPPQHGSVTLNSDGTFVYTPQPNYNGPDSFTYRANDGELNSNVATVNINVTAVNDAPTGVADNYTVGEEGTLTVGAAEGVLANDTDVEGSSFTAAVVTGPAKGQLTFATDGSFTYRPNLNFVGRDTFTYRPSDATQGQPTTVTIQVTPVNDAPVANNDTVSLAEDTSITFTGPTPQGFTPVQWASNGHYYAQVRTGITWANAKNAAESLRFRGSQGHLVTVGSESEHQFLVASVLTGIAQRYWIGLTDEGTEGNFRWTTGEPVTYTNWGQGRPDNAGGNEHYVEVVHDSGTPFWRWNDITATFTGNGYVVEFEGPFNQGVLDNDQDVDNDALTAQLVAGPSHGQLTLNANGTFTYTPNPNFTGTDSFTYKARDGQLESNVATVTLIVSARQRSARRRSRFVLCGQYVDRDASPGRAGERYRYRFAGGQPERATNNVPRARDADVQRQRLVHIHSRAVVYRQRHVHLSHERRNGNVGAHYCHDRIGAKAADGERHDRFAPARAG